MTSLSQAGLDLAMLMSTGKGISVSGIVAHRIGLAILYAKNLPKTVVPPRRLEKGEKIREGSVSQEGSRRTWKEREGNESQRSRVEWKEWSRVE